MEVQIKVEIVVILNHIVGTSKELNQVLVRDIEM